VGDRYNTNTGRCHVIDTCSNSSMGKGSVWFTTYILGAEDNICRAASRLGLEIGQLFVFDGRKTVNACIGQLLHKRNSLVKTYRR
jgi:hypothetical protein